MHTGGRKNQAISHWEPFLNANASGMERNCWVDINHNSLLHDRNRLKRLVVRPLLTDSFENLVETDHGYYELVRVLH